jgi:hypothetical protein
LVISSKPNLDGGLFDPDKAFRWTIDYRAVNQDLDLSHFPLPDLDEMLAQFASGKNYFSVMDSVSGYWQVAITEAAGDILAFEADGAVYSPTRLPQGMAGAGTYFQASQSIGFADFIEEEEAYVYQDDGLTGAKDIDSALDVLDRYLQRCSELNVRLGPKKFQVLAKEVKYGGSIITGEGSAICPSRKQGILDTVAPVNAGELTTFLHVAQWVADYVPRFKQLAAPMYTLLREAQKHSAAGGAMSKQKLSRVKLDGRRGHEQVTWTEEHDESFEAVKQAIGNACMKHHPRVGYTYTLATDANDSHIGGFLGLIPDADIDKPLETLTSIKPVAFTSWRLSGPELKFSTVEKEALSVIQNIRRFKTMIQGSRPFMLYTDSEALSHLLHPNKHQTTSQARARLHRWLMNIHEFFFRAYHVPGESNIISDMMTRMTNARHDPDRPVVSEVHLISNSHPAVRGMLEFEDHPGIFGPASTSPVSEPINAASIYVGSPPQLSSSGKSALDKRTGHLSRCGTGSSHSHLQAETSIVTTSVDSLFVDNEEPARDSHVTIGVIDQDTMTIEGASYSIHSLLCRRLVDHSIVVPLSSGSSAHNDTINVSSSPFSRTPVAVRGISVPTSEPYNSMAYSRMVWTPPVEVNPLVINVSSVRLASSNSILAYTSLDQWVQPKSPHENLTSLIDLSLPVLAGQSPHLYIRALRVADVAIAPIPLLERPTLSEIRIAQNRALISLKAQGRVTTPPATPAPSGWVGGVRVVNGNSLRQLLPSMAWATVIKKQIWIPDEDSLRIRLVVIAHFGDRGHVGAEAMASALRVTYFWPRLDELVGEIRAICIHCAGRGKTRVPRPLSEMPHSSRSFQAIHMDYLTLSDVEAMDSMLSLDTFVGKYLLIIRCDFTGFTRLYPCEKADSFTAVNAVIDWCSTYGTPEWLRTDQGKHLSEGFFKELDARWEAAHYMSTAYASWSNGFVERTMSVIMQTLLSLLSERRLTVKDWKQMVPMVQARLNQTPTRILGNRSPLEVITGYKPGTILSLIPVMSVPEGTRRTATLEAFKTTQLRAVDEYVAQAQEHLWSLHRDLTGRQAKIRSRSRRAHNEKVARNTGANQPIVEGDYVLHLVQGGKRRSKMLYYWRGPKQVVGRIHDHTFLIKDLVSGETSEAHDSYLRFYMDRQRGSEVDKERLLAQYKFEETLYIPDAITDHHELNGLIMFVVKWRGMDEITEESLPRFYKDVPHIVDKYVKNLPNKNQRDVINQAIARLSSARS